MNVYKGKITMTKHEIVVRDALRLYEIMYTSLFTIYVDHYVAFNQSAWVFKRRMLKAKTRAIIAHDRHLIRLSE